MEVSKMTAPVMSSYEKSTVIIKRIQGLDSNKPSTVNLSELKDKNITSSYDIAIYEFEQNKLPYYEVIRKYPNGNYEKWIHSDFKYYPD